MLFFASMVQGVEAVVDRSPRCRPNEGRAPLVTDPSMLTLLWYSLAVVLVEEPYWTQNPMKAVLLLCPLPSEIMLLLMFVVAALPSRKKMPSAVGGRVVDVPVLRLLSP